MKGKHTIEIGDKRVKYEITVKRKLSVVIGNSATGKLLFVILLGNILEGKVHINMNPFIVKAIVNW